MLPEFQVDTSSPGYSICGGVATGNDGQFVVTWTEFESDPDILGRRFDAQGTPLDVPFPINEVTTGYQASSSVARDASGRSVVVWSDENASIFGRRFGADGTPLGDSFQINTSTASFSPRVACDLSGNFVVAWNSGGQVVARRFDSNGASLGDPFPVGSQPYNQPGLAMSTAGFVVVWTGGFESYARRFDPAGNPMTDAIPVAAFAPFQGLITSTDVAMGEDGAFVVVWDDCIGDICFPIGMTDVAMGGVAGTKGRRYFSDGTPRGDSFSIQPGGGGPRVASDSVNNFLVTWASGSGSAEARYYDIFGQAVSPAFPVSETAAWSGAHPALADDGSFVVAWTGGGSYDLEDVKGRKSAIRAAAAINLDAGSGLGAQPSAAAGNGVFEPGETLVLETAWVNDSAGDVAVSGMAPLLNGPFGPTYTINDNTASYGTIAAGQSATCIGGADCYSVTVSAPAVRPVQHWDALLQETLSIGVPKNWKLHIGESFPDVPTGNLFYTFIETVFHNGVTAGCFGGGYCPADPVTRAQMAVFLLKSKFGSAHVPPPCTGAVFSDVPCTGSPFDPWIEELSALGITGGCGGGLYCPNNTVTRGQMAVLLLKTREGSAYNPPDCAGIFADVPCTPGEGFSDWIEELYNRSITGGCSASPLEYCPTNASNRGQMAALLTKSFGLVLYGGR